MEKSPKKLSPAKHKPLEFPENNEKFEAFAVAEPDGFISAGYAPPPTLSKLPPWLRKKKPGSNPPLGPRSPK